MWPHQPEKDQTHLKQLGCDEEVLLAAWPASVEHDAAEHLPLVPGVHPLVDLVHHPERAALQILQEQEDTESMVDMAAGRRQSKRGQGDAGAFCCDNPLQSQSTGYRLRTYVNVIHHAAPVYMGIHSKEHVGLTRPALLRGPQTPIPCDGPSNVITGAFISRRAEWPLTTRLHQRSSYHSSTRHNQADLQKQTTRTP